MDFGEINGEIMKEKKLFFNFVDFLWYVKKLVGCFNYVMDVVFDKFFFFCF